MSIGGGGLGGLHIPGKLLSIFHRLNRIIDAGICKVTRSAHNSVLFRGVESFPKGELN